MGVEKIAHIVLEREDKSFGIDTLVGKASLNPKFKQVHPYSRCTTKMYKNIPFALAMVRI